MLLMDSSKCMNLCMSSYNCRGYNEHKRDYLASLLSRCDILFLQEHWLSDGQLNVLNNISADHECFGVCGFDNTTVLRGRPYGGCAVFWRNNIAVQINMIEVNTNRMCALQICSGDVDLLLVNVYMPYVSTDAAYDEFCLILSNITHVSEMYPESMLVIGGDFNADLSRSTSHLSAINSFCRQHNLRFAVEHSASSVDYTYNFCMTRFSVLDHFIVPVHVFDSCIQSVESVHEVDNLSDHSPLQMQLNVAVTCFASTSQKPTVKKPAWQKANDKHLAHYKSVLMDHLSRISVPSSTVICRNVRCTDQTHCTLLEQYANNIVQACLTAAASSIPVQGIKTHKTKPCTSGWTEYVEPVRNESIFWHSL